MVIPKWVILSSEFYPTMIEVPTAKKKEKFTYKSYRQTKQVDSS